MAYWSFWINRWINVSPIILRADETPEGHECASPSLYGCDIPLLNYLLQDLRVLIRRAAAGEQDIAPHQNFEWAVHGLKRHTIVCDPERLKSSFEVNIVGFFGDRRATSVGIESVDEVESQLHEEFRSYPGILSYSSAELVDDQWVDLVVHTDPADREEWRGSKVHAHAVERLAPLMYHSVRIHNGCVPDGPIGSESVIIENTKYWDYDCDPVWHAFRDLPRGAVGSVVEAEGVIDTVAPIGRLHELVDEDLGPDVLEPPLT